jgi:hypothetical protein
MQQSVQATNNFIAPRIFPDASVIVKYGDGGKLPPFIHAAAVVLDPTAEIFYDIEQSLNMTRLNKYRIDSIGLPCLYRRHIQDPEIVDTLVIEMISNIRGPYYSYTGMQSEFGYDTVWFCGLKRTNVNFNYLRPDASTEVIKRKIPLTAQTAADTLSSGINYIYFPSSQTNYYGKLCAFTFKFIPGYQWEKNDTLNLTLNEFMFFSYEEQGDNTYPYYTPGNYNSSQIVSSDNLNPNDSYYKAQLYCPSVAFAINYQGENHLVDFKLVSNNVEINEVRSLKSDVRIYPNPADQLTTINYQLSTNSNVNMFIYDLTGKKVMELKQGKQTAGIHKININTSALSKGMYYYTLTRDNNSITRKMIIER